MALTDLIAQLPEIYQPIFGHPELAPHPSRLCEDRLHDIMPVYDALQKLLGRPLRVLDLGCAQGYFSFSLAEHCAIVHGVDILQENIDLCNAIAKDNPNLRITFESRPLEDVLANLKEDQFDLILGLSVFHHIVHEKGANFVRQMLRDLSSKVGICIFEFALPAEPVYWASGQPEDPRYLIHDFAFMHEFATHGTHLSEIVRPMYVASNSFWFFDGFAGRFLSWKTFPHALAVGAHQERRYYFDNDKFIKIYKIKKTLGRNDHEESNFGAVNYAEIVREAEFLRNPPPGFPVPKLITAGINDQEAWLVRELIPGELLLDIIQHNKKYNPVKVLEDVLDQCVMLEEAGYYHNDIRTWNVLMLSDGHATLMDHGAIIKSPLDCVWPENIFLSFFIFIYEVISGHDLDPTPMRIPAMNPGWFEPPYREFIMAFLSKPYSMWSFECMRSLFYEQVIQSTDQSLHGADLSYFALWQLAMEKAIAIGTANHRIAARRLNQIEADSRELNALQKAQNSRELNALQKAQNDQLQQLNDEIESLKSKLHSVEGELHSRYSSRCWSITAPLRYSSDLILKTLNTVRKFPQSISHRMGEFLYSQDKGVRSIEDHPAPESPDQTSTHEDHQPNKRQNQNPREDIPRQPTKASLASGFYPPEYWSGIKTHWMQAEATLEVNSIVKCAADLKLRAMAFYRPRTIEVHAGGILAGRVKIPMDRFVEVTVQVTLSEGINIIRLLVPEGCERACDWAELNNPDTRCLSVAVQNVLVSQPNHDTYI